MICHLAYPKGSHRNFHFVKMYTLEICLNRMKILKVLVHYFRVLKYLTKPILKYSHMKM